MNYEELLTFLTVCEQGSIIQAAQALYIEQGTASRRISRLEKELGLSLLNRNKGQRETFLTESGQEFYPIARQMMALMDDAMNLRSRQIGQLFRVTSTNSINSVYMLPLYKQFLHCCPDVEIYSQVEHSQEIFEMVDRHECDLGFVSALHPMPNVVTQALLTEKLVLLFHNESPFAKTGTLSDLDSDQEVFFRYSTAFKDWHQSTFPYSSRRKITLGNMTQFEIFLDTPESWSIVPERSALAFIETHPDWSYSASHIHPPVRTIYAIWNKYPRPGIRTHIHDLLNMFDSAYVYRAKD